MKRYLRKSLLLLVAVLMLFATGCSMSYKPPENLTADQKMLTLVKPAVVRPVTAITIVWQINNKSVSDRLGSNPYKQSFTVTGSGWFISPDGYVVTNAHVSEYAHMSDKELANALLPQLASVLAQNLGQDSLTQSQTDILIRSIVNYSISKSFFVLTPGGENLPAEIKAYGVPIGEDVSGKDVAILKVEGKNFPTLPIADSDTVKDADKVYIIGYPGAADMNGLFDDKSILESTTSDGSIQARKNTAQGTPVIQLGGSVNPGNSGGPVVNQKGEVIGIATYKAARGENVNFAVPMNTIMEFVRSAGTAPKASDTSKRFEEAMNLYWTGHHTKAIAKFDELLRLYPAHSLAKKYQSEAESHKSEEPPMDPTLMLGLMIGVGVLVLAVVVGVVLMLRRRPKPAAPSAGVGANLPPAPPAPPQMAYPAPQPVAPPQPALAPQPQPPVMPHPAVAHPAATQPAPAYQPAPAPAPAPVAVTPPPAPAAPGMHGYGSLHFFSGPFAGVKLPLPSSGLYIGSNPGEGGLTVPDPRISPRHCWIGPSNNGQVVIMDLGSTSGTFVGTIPAGLVQQAELYPGCDIYLGSDGAVALRYEV